MSFTYRNSYAIPFSQAEDAGIGSWSGEDAALHVIRWPVNDLMIICNHPKAGALREHLQEDTTR